VAAVVTIFRNGTFATHTLHTHTLHMVSLPASSFPFLFSSPFLLLTTTTHPTSRCHCYDVPDRLTRGCEQQTL